MPDLKLIKAYLLCSLQIAIQLAAHLLEKYYPSHVIGRLSISEEEFWDNKVKKNC